MPKVSAFWGDLGASSLGLTYASGQGVPQAAAWSGKAADQGYADAQLSLAQCTPMADTIMVGTARTHMWPTLY
jgi:TPR repeat protein